MLPDAKSLCFRVIFYLMIWTKFNDSVTAISTNLRRYTCTNELENANRTISNWSAAMEKMVLESSTPKLTNETLLKEQTRIKNLIENFSANMNKRPIERLVKDLESIRRVSNRMALNKYLETFDMRWPQTSVQLGVAVERVQQACLSNLDRAAILVLNSPFSSLSRSQSSGKSISTVSTFLTGFQSEIIPSHVIKNSQLQLDKRRTSHTQSNPFIPVKQEMVAIDTSKTRFVYPELDRDGSSVEEIFNVNVTDPYRFLEDPHAEKTKQFVESQNKISEPFFQSCPHRLRIREILLNSQNYKRIGCSFKRGGKYYFFMNTGLQPQSVLYQQDKLDSEPKVFFDPNLLSDDGTVALSLTAFSPNGEYFAYGLSYSGSDWIEIGIKHIPSGKELPEKLKRAKFTSIGWTHDNKGFFYAQFPSQKQSTGGIETGVNLNHSLYYHLLNTEQSEDILKLDFPEHPKWLLGFEISQDGKHIHILPSEGCSDNLWYYCDLGDFSVNDKLKVQTIYDQPGSQLEYIINNNDIVYFKTNINAKNYRVVKLDLKNPAIDNWVDVVPSHPEDVLDWAEVYTVGNQDYILLNFMRKVFHQLELHKLEGPLVKKFETPPGTITKYSGKRNDGEFFYLFTSFLTPGQTFHFNLDRLDSEPKMLRQALPENFNPDEYVINQKFYKSKDGTEIPMFIVHLKSLVRDGTNPCLLYGYGGFNIQITSTFNINRIIWLKNFKGIFAVANIRGGGELGKDWHDSGALLNKQNCFDDFIAAGEYLVENKYTQKERLAIEGGSNGGLLVAATSNKRPDLFGATICHVGVLDMIRFSSFTIGYAWISEYGDPKEKKHFDNLIKYSPYHNIPETATKYPATLLLTADHDDRVVPAHSLKFIAELQYKLGKKLSDTPMIIRVDTKAGHGGGRPVAKVIDENADIYSFLYNTLRLENHYNDD